MIIAHLDLFLQEKCDRCAIGTRLPVKTEREIYVIQRPKALVSAFYLSRRHASANVPSIFVDDFGLRLVPVAKRSPESAIIRKMNKP